MWLVWLICGDGVWFSVGTATYRYLLSELSPRSVANAGPPAESGLAFVRGWSKLTWPLRRLRTREIAPIPDAMSGTVSDRLLVTNAYLPSPVMAIQHVPRPTWKAPPA